MNLPNLTIKLVSRNFGHIVLSSIKIGKFIEKAKEYFEINNILKVVLNPAKNQDEVELENINFTRGNFIIVINDSEKGSKFLYENFKNQIVATNKTVRLETIVNEENYDTLIGLIYLALNYRSKKDIALHQTQKTLPILAFSIVKNFEKNYFLLLNSSINKNKLLADKLFIPSFKADELNETKVVIRKFIQNKIDSIRECLLNQNSEKIIILFKNVFDFKNIISDFTNLTDVILVEILDQQFKMFNVRESFDLIEIPKNGSFIFKKIDGNRIQVALLTNGLPDNPEKGTPNPILIEITLNGLKDELLAKNVKNVVESFFYHTFYHPTSFSKPNVPIELHSLSNIWKSSLKSIISKNNDWVML